MRRSIPPAGLRERLERVFSIDQAIDVQWFTLDQGGCEFFSDEWFGTRVGKDEPE